MRRPLRISTLSLLAAALGAAFACSEGTTTATTPSGNGAEDELGGAAAVNPAASATAATETGGTPAAAATGSGGASAAPAATNNPAAAGAAPVAAAAGGTSSGSVHSSKPAAQCFDFAEDTEDWVKNYALIHQAADKALRDDAASEKMFADSLVDWMATEGYGGVNGYVRLTIAVAPTQSEFQGFVFSYLTNTSPMKLAGKVITAYVKLASGLTAKDSSNPSGAKAFVKTGSGYFFADGGWVNLTPNQWTKISVDVSTPANKDTSKDAALYDPNDVYEFGIEIDTSGSATTVETPGIVYVDHVCIQ